MGRGMRGDTVSPEESIRYVYFAVSKINTLFMLFFLSAYNTIMPAYQNMVDIYHASNHTKSDVLFYWYTPDPLVNTFVGTGNVLIFG